MEDGDVAEDVAQSTEMTHTIGVYLEEVVYFLEDMKKDLWWLLQFAHQPSGETFARGDEELGPIDSAVQAIIDRVKLRAEQHHESHGNQVRAKIMIVPGVSNEERVVMSAVKKLRFHCGGSIEVFLCMKEANNGAIFAAYQNFVAGNQPQWLVKSDSPGAKKAFAGCVVLVPVFINKAKEEIKLLNVWCPEKKKKHWAFMGGDVKRGVDRHLFDAANREFKEEVGIFFNRSWSECFQAELPDVWTEDEQPCEGCMVYTYLEKDGVRYPCRPHVFMTVTEDFYEVTRAYEDDRGVIQMSRSIQQAGLKEFVRWDALKRKDEDGGDDGAGDNNIAQKVHTEGVPFLEHDEARWVNLEFQTGKFSADDSRPLRKESADLFKQRPEALWQYFADLLGVDPPAKESCLPADFGEDQPMAVRLSGIDKTATDQDIIDFFDEVQVTVTNVRQFEVPKHTARADVEDKEQLERALAMNGRTLLRRKVKVELFREGGESGALDKGTPMQEYTGPLPEEGPWMARIRHLDRSVTKDDLGYFFWDRDCQVSDVHFPLRGERHAGLIEYKDLDSLRKAMGLNNATFKGREITIEIASKGDIKKDEMAASASKGGGGGGKGGDRGDRGAGGGFRDNFGGGKGKGGGGKGGGFGRDRDRDDGGGFGRDRDRDDGGGFGRDRDAPSRADFGSERPRLQLKPRSAPDAQQGGGEDRGEAAGYNGSSGRADPFGGARQGGGGGVPDRFKNTRADEDNNWRR